MILFIIMISSVDNKGQNKHIQCNNSKKTS